MRAPILMLSSLLAACASSSPSRPGQPASATDYYGTLEPFAAESVYFVVTDRFVNGDEANDYRDQGGELGSFDIPLHCPDGVVDNVGYLGGDFRGLLDHAGYIRDMGFTAVWITPIAENPDQRFSGGDPITCTSILTDRGKAAYHGYWAINFHRTDEHLVSADLDFAGLTRGLRAAGLKTVLDIVGNHGSPAWGMPQRQPQFGQLFDADGNLRADHQNLAPAELDPARNPLHAWFNTEGNLAQLADLDASNPQVVEYLVSAYLEWIAQGADAFRVDTIAYQPHAFWKTVADRLRAERPGFFMFGESFAYDAGKIAPHTWAENGGYSVLDFPLKQALDEVFAQDAGFERLAPALHLSGGPYRNPYELTTFYDNHDMARMNADDDGFVDAHHWLFTARGIPVIYYGSEIGFMRGAVEHHGNRNYFGVESIARAKTHRIRERLARIAQLRASSPALQLNLELQGDRAAFYRVFQHDGVAQTALVLLNKGDTPARFELGERLEPGAWRNAFGGVSLTISDGTAPTIEVGAHDAVVWLMDAPVSSAWLRGELDRAMREAATRHP
jgi:cyclomaltodextrin glucanotransferase